MIQYHGARRAEQVRVLAGVSEREDRLRPDELELALEVEVEAGGSGGSWDLPIFRRWRRLRFLALRQMREVRIFCRALAAAKDVTKKPHRSLVERAVTG